MIIHKLSKCSWLNDNLKDGLVSGIALGIALGIVLGIASETIYEVVFGLVSGLAFGLVFGLIYGLTYGLVTITSNYPEFIPIWVLVIGIIAIMELFFFLDDKQPKKEENKIWFTAKRKFYALFDTLLILVNINNIRIISKELEINWIIVKDWIGYIGIGIGTILIVSGILYLFLKLNSLRYNKVSVPIKKRGRK